MSTKTNLTYSGKHDTGKADCTGVWSSMYEPGSNIKRTVNLIRGLPLCLFASGRARTYFSEQKRIFLFGIACLSFVL